ncbi:unnamed protein product, partial [Meganyctiphanes norvegica]
MRCKGRLFISISGIMMVLILFDYHTSTRSIVADRYKKTVIEAENMENKYISSVNNEEPIFMIVVCGGSGTNENTQKNYKNQLRQTAVLLKSAAALTKTYLRFLVITDSKSIYEDITASFHSWSPEYQHRLSLEYHPVWYPADRSDVIAMYKPCSTQRLFLPSMFPQIDATIYVDTDAIFMRPPEDLWNEFVNFAPDHVMGISTEAYWYKSSENKVPYYGKNGLNAGLILMNLTRLRHFPGEDWTQASMNILDQFKNDLKLGDQDIINVLFNKVIFISNYHSEPQAKYCVMKMKRKTVCIAFKYTLRGFRNTFLKKIRSAPS